MIDLESVDLTRLEATISTDRGEIVVRFHADKAPRHVRNFAELAQKGFYDGVAFHRVIRNFMIQTGCPHTRDGESGTPGTGGPGYTVDAEFNDLEHSRGALSMARGPDPNSAGSQFFVVHADHVPSLDGAYTVFGFVKEGLDVLDAIATVECEFGAGGERSAPVERIELNGIELRELEESEVQAGDEKQPEKAAASVPAAEPEPAQAQPEQATSEQVESEFDDADGEADAEVDDDDFDMDDGEDFDAEVDDEDLDDGEDFDAEVDEDEDLDDGEGFDDEVEEDESKNESVAAESEEGAS